MRLELFIDKIPVKFQDKLELELYNPNLPEEMCVPEELASGKFYRFNISGGNVFPFDSTINLYAGGDTKNPLAQIEITEQTSFLIAGHIYTKG